MYSIRGMNVHIVCEVGGTHVLQRMARALADETGWSLSTTPDPAADVNYFLPYLSWQPVGTRTAAYFTHLETGDSGKATKWHAVDVRVDGRIVTASRYLAHLHGSRAMARPPVDLGKFTPERRRRGPTRTVGVSGMVYTTGRKGEHLVEMLARSPLGRRLKIVASGRGWSVNTARYPWETMQEFYRGLDVFLCTSLIEGVPMPPLEALACGVPVVVPVDVGMLDDLPDAVGVYRYRAGNYDEMITALQGALDDVDRLRQGEEMHLPGFVAQYTATNWAADHEKAFGAWFARAER